MATISWIPKAHATKQIDTITVAGTWAAADTVTLTMNGKDLVITIGNGTTTAQVAASIRDAWNATSRLDGTGTTTNTSNFGGQEFGEFSEATAEVFSTSDTIVRITAKTAGYPFTLSVTEATVGDGTATETTAQAATGPNHWNNGDNWSGGSAPSSNDIVVFQNTSIGPQFGLPAGSMEVTFRVYQSFTGVIGLPSVNQRNASKPYPEYRQQYVHLDDAGGGSSITHVFGLGSGLGSPLIKLWHDDDSGAGALALAAIVYNTGTPQTAGPGGQPVGSKALHIGFRSTGAAATVTVLHGSVQLFGTPEAPEVAVFTALTIGEASDIDVAVSEATGTSFTIVQNGGNLTISGSPITLTALTITMYGGVCTQELTGTITTYTALVYDARLVWNTTATVAALTIGSGGIFDASQGAGGFTATTCDMFERAQLLDGGARGTYTAGIDLNRCKLYTPNEPNGAIVDVGTNRRLTPGAVA